MKKIYFLLYFICIGAFAQNVTITKVIEANCSSPFVKTVELYVDGTVDFANDDIFINYMSNGGPWEQEPDIDLSPLGVQTDSFVYLVRDIPLMQAEFPSTTFDASNTVVVGTSTNGDDGYQVVYNGVVVSQFGETATDGSGTGWEHGDAVATRLDAVPDNGDFDINDWAFTPGDSLDDETLCEATSGAIGSGLEAYFNSLGDTFPLGSGSDWTPVCSTIFGDIVTTCNSTGNGSTDDTYSVSIDFTGGNNGSAFVVTSNEGTVGGDDPTSVESGTITVNNIPEGTNITVSASNVADGGNCSLSENITSPGCVPLVLNEVLFDPPSDLPGDANNDGTRDAQDDEFIEFFNNSNATLDISGYKIYDASALASDEPRHIVPAGTIIPANGAYVIFGGGTPTGSFGTAIVQAASNGPLNLNNGGDVITVSNANDQVVIEFDTSDYSLDFGEDQSITRSPDITGDFVLHTTANVDLLFSPGLEVNGATLSIEDNSLTSNLKLYPNPVTNNRLTIDAKTEINSYKIYNMIGVEVLSNQNYNQQPINVSQLESGAYFISVTAQGKTINKKIIIK